MTSALGGEIVITTKQRRALISDIDKGEEMSKNPNILQTSPMDVP